MDGIDAKVFALIAAGTVTAVGAIKKFAPVWVSGKEEALAQILPVLFTVIAKLSGSFKGTDWVDALLYAVGAGLAAGVSHDKILGVIKGTKSMAGVGGDLK
jgi:hypothetical protein